MSVPVQDPINQIVIVGGETLIPWTWNLQQESEITVLVQRALDDSVDTLILNTDYTVDANGLDNDNGGNITPIGSESPVTTGDIWTLFRVTAIDRSPDFAVKGDFFAQTINKQLDELTRISQDINRDSAESVRKDPGVGDTLDPLIPQPVDERALKFRDTGGGNFEMVMSDSDPDQQSNEADNSAAAALASEQAAAISETNAETAETGAGTAETGAETAQAAAETAQAASEAAAASGLYKNVFDIDFSDSPYTILNTQDGFLIQVDTSGGNVVVNLIDSTVLSADFRIGVARMTGGANTLTIQRQGTDTINGVTSVTIPTQYQTLNLILDQSQGEWLSTDISLANLSSPPPIGDVTPNAIGGTDITATGEFDGALGTANPKAAKVTTLEATTSIKGNAGQAITQFDNDGNLAANSSTRGVTQAAVKTAIEAGGKVLQVVYFSNSALVTTTSIIPKDDTIPQNTEGVEVMTLAITPKNASSKLIIEAGALTGVTFSTTVITLFIDSTANALTAARFFNAFSNNAHMLFLSHQENSNNTTSRTYKIRFGTISGTAYFNGDDGAREYGSLNKSFIKITEVVP